MRATAGRFRTVTCGRLSFWGEQAHFHIGHVDGIDLTRPFVGDVDLAHTGVQDFHPRAAFGGVAGFAAATAVDGCATPQLIASSRFFRC